MEKVEYKEQVIAVVSGEDIVMKDAATALDLMMTAKYEHGAERLAIQKECICEDFFVLSTGVAGEILQKFINYRVKLAIYGDFSHYTSKPLKDFMYESNKGKDIFFQDSLEAALDKLTNA